MKSKLSFAVACLLVPILACANETRGTAETSVIARVGAKEIQYRDIRCDARFQAPPPDDARCHAFEQQKLDALVTEELIAAAARIHGITVSDQEALAAAPKGATPSPAELQELEKRFKTMAAGVLKVHDGASADDVFANDVAPKGISRPEFDAARSKWSREAAQKALTLDYPREAQRQVIAQQRSRLLLRRINELGATRASEKAVSPEQAHRDFWREVMTKTGTKIIDTRYSLPNMGRL
jgi:hypothetical protein